MNLILMLLIQTVLTLAGVFFVNYIQQKGKNLATKKDIAEITKQIEVVKNLYKQAYDLSRTEREFYDKMIAIIYKFSAEIKKYEFENKTEVTEAIFLSDLGFRNKLFEFKDSASEFVGKSYVFLKEENYLNLKAALATTSSFADLTNNLLDAMRKSLYPDTGLTSKDDLREFKY